MPLHIEISGDCSPREWQAIAAFVRTMTDDAGTPAAHPVTVELSAEARTMSEALSSGLLDPVAPVEAAMAATLAALEAGAVLDSSGLPWDSRVHASTKTINKDGTWKAARGVDPAMKAAVEAELRTIMAVPAPPADLDPAAAFPAPTPGNDALPGTVASLAPDTTPGVGVAVPPAIGPNALPLASPSNPVPPPPPETNPFAALMKKLVAKQAAGVVNTEMTTALCVQLGLTGIKDLAIRPDLIPSFEALLP